MDKPIIVRLSRSQQMALIDVLIGYMRNHDFQDLPQEFVDASNGAVTTPGELLRLVSGADSEVH